MEKVDKNALARAQRQFYNEYASALADPNRPVPTANEVADMFIKAEMDHLGGKG